MSDTITDSPTAFFYWLFVGLIGIGAGTVSYGVLVLLGRIIVTLSRGCL